MDAVQNQRDIWKKKKKKANHHQQLPTKHHQQCLWCALFTVGLQKLISVVDFLLVFFCNPVALGLLLKQIVTRPFLLL